MIGRLTKGPGPELIEAEVLSNREDFLEYFNTNADGEDRSEDDATSEASDGIYVSVV
jgi:hypothetical protein